MPDHRVAIVTGSSRGIGRSIASQLAGEGYAVVVNYMSSPDAAAEVVSEIESSGGQAISAKANVGIESDRKHLIDETIETFGRLDVLVNNAGITSQGRMDILEATEESWDLVFDTNLKGPFFLSQLAAKRMIHFIEERKIDRGTIINVSSISAYAASTNRADYCIAKSAMKMMTGLFAARLAEEQIRVYEVCPGVIESDMTAPVKERYDKLIAEGLSPMLRWGRPEDVAKAVSMLVSDALSFSTGERINVDGGFHIRRL